MNTKCPHCDFPTTVPSAQIQMSPFKTLVCAQCGRRYRPKPAKKGRSDAQRRSRDQETKAARRYGARKQPGSGSKGSAKSDIRRKDVLRGECKETTKESYRLKLKDLLKLEKEARGSETPLFEVQFQGVHPFKTYVVLPADEYQALLGELEQHRSRGVQFHWGDDEGNQDNRGSEPGKQGGGGGSAGAGHRRG